MISKIYILIQMSSLIIQRVPLFIYFLTLFMTAILTVILVTNSAYELRRYQEKK